MPSLARYPRFWRALLFLQLFATTAICLAHPGWGVVIDKQGNIYFGDVNRNIVWKIDARGSVHKFVSGKHSHILWIDDLGTVYGQHIEYDSRNSRWIYEYWKAASDGIVKELQQTEVRRAFGFADGDGNTYLLDSDAHKRISHIFKVSPRGDTSLFAGGEWGDRDGVGREAQFRAFGWGVRGTDGSLYVTSGGMVRKISPGGAVTTLAGREQGFGDPDGEPRASSFLGIARDGEGNIYAANWEKRKVIRISPRGEITTALDSGMLWAPSGVAVVGRDVYVLEHRAGVTGLLEKAGMGGPRIRKISADGNVKIVGTAP